MCTTCSECWELSKKATKHMYSIYSHVTGASLEVRPHEGALSRRFWRRVMMHFPLWGLVGRSTLLWRSGRMSFLLRIRVNMINVASPCVVVMAILDVLEVVWQVTGYQRGVVDFVNKAQCKLFYSVLHAEPAHFEEVSRSEVRSGGGGLVVTWLVCFGMFGVLFLEP